MPGCERRLSYAGILGCTSTVEWSSFACFLCLYIMRFDRFFQSKILFLKVLCESWMTWLMCDNRAQSGDETGETRVIHGQRLKPL